MSSKFEPFCEKNLKLWVQIAHFGLISTALGITFTEPSTYYINEFKTIVLTENKDVDAKVYMNKCNLSGVSRLLGRARAFPIFAFYQFLHVLGLESTFGKIS